MLRFAACSDDDLNLGLVNSIYALPCQMEPESILARS